MNHARSLGPLFVLVLITASIITPATHSPKAEARGKTPALIRPPHEGNPPRPIPPPQPVPPPRRPYVSVGGAHETIARAVYGCDTLCESIAAVGRWVKAKGFRVSQHPLYGGVCYCHSWGSAHYLGHAIDVNEDGPQEMSRLDWLYAKLRAVPGIVMYWRTPGHWDHLHAELDGGGARSE